MNVLVYLLAGTEYIPSTEIRIPELPLRWCIIYVYGLYLLSDFPISNERKNRLSADSGVAFTDRLVAGKTFLDVSCGDGLFDNRDIDDPFVLCLA